MSVRPVAITLLLTLGAGCGTPGAALRAAAPLDDEAAGRAEARHAGALPEDFSLRAALDQCEWRKRALFERHNRRQRRVQGVLLAMLGLSVVGWTLFGPSLQWTQNGGSTAFWTVFSVGMAYLATTFGLGIGALLDHGRAEDDEASVLTLHKEIAQAAAGDPTGELTRKLWQHCR